MKTTHIDVEKRKRGIIWNFEEVYCTLPMFASFHPSMVIRYDK
jgi:hypothetical protein